MAYDPFQPGPYTVGARVGIAIDRNRNDRPLPFDDQIANPGPCLPEHAHTFTRGPSLAHLTRSCVGTAARKRSLKVTRSQRSVNGA